MGVFKNMLYCPVFIFGCERILRASLDVSCYGDTGAVGELAAHAHGRNRKLSGIGMHLTRTWY